MTSISLSPTSITLSTSTPKMKHENHYAYLTRDDDDDDISLAKCMTRKLQSKQQMNPCMSPGLVALHQQHGSPISRDSNYAINRYSHSHYHQLQLQLKYQQQLMLQYQQQQQQQQNLTWRHGSSLRQHHHHYHRHQQRSPGMKQQPIITKLNSAQLDLDHDPKIRISPPPSTHRVSCPSPISISPSSTSIPEKDHRRQRHSLISLQSDGMTRKNRYSQRGCWQEKQQQQHERNPSTAPMVKQIMNRKSSIYSHASSTSSSTTTSNLANTTNELTKSPVSTPMSKNHSKLSLSKRIRGVIMGKGTNKQTHAVSSTASSSLRRSSSVASGTSSVLTIKTADNGNYSSGSLWTNLLRKSSKFRPSNHDYEKKSVHGKLSNERKDVVPDSPASSVSENSYHRSFLNHQNCFADDLPSPASSTSPESLLNYSTDEPHIDNHLDTLQKIEPSDQLDYFGPSSPLSQQQQQQQKKTNPYTLLQHGSPRLRPSPNHQQNSSSLLVAESDDLPACSLETFIPGNSTKSPRVSPPPISSASSSASTSTSSLALNHQQDDTIKPTSKSLTAKPNTTIQFSTTVQTLDTFGSQDYDRRCDTPVTCQRLTAILALQIKKELNEYKLNEMQVHIQSRQNTQFFL